MPGVYRYQRLSSSAFLVPTLWLSMMVVVWMPLHCSARRRKDGNPLSRGIVVKNRAGCKLAFFWINPNTQELAASSTDGGIVHGGESSLSSYIGHEFEVHELPGRKTGKCKEEVCRTTYFSVSANEDQSK